MPTQRSGAHWAPSEIDAQRLTDQLRASRLTVLCGGPGAPTPQVLQAGVLPRVHRRAEDRGKGDRAASAKALGFEDRRHGSSGSDAEVCVLFDQWGPSARAALKSALQDALRGHAAARGGKLPQRFDDLVIALSERHRVRFLLLFDRFEDCLRAHPNSDVRALREEIYSAVNRTQVPAHVLLTLRENGEPLLDRLRGRIRGFDPVRKPYPLDGAQGIGPWTLSWVPPVLAAARSRPPKTQAVYASIEALLGQMAQRGASEPAEPLSAEDEALLASAADAVGTDTEAADPASAAFEPMAFTAYGRGDPDEPAFDDRPPLAQDEHWAAFDVPMPAAEPAAAAESAAEAAPEEPPAAVDPLAPAPAEPPAETQAEAGPAPVDIASPGVDAPQAPPARAPTTTSPRAPRPTAALGATFSAASLAQFMAELDDVIAESSAPAADAVRPPQPPPVLADLADWPDVPWAGAKPSASSPPALPSDDGPAVQQAVDGDRDGEGTVPGSGIDASSGPPPATETTDAPPAAAAPEAPVVTVAADADGSSDAHETLAADAAPVDEDATAPPPESAAAAEADPPADAPLGDAEPLEPTATTEPPEPTEKAESIEKAEPAAPPDTPSTSRDVATVADPPAPAAEQPGRRGWGDTLRQRRSLRAAQRAAAPAPGDEASTPRPFWQRWQFPASTTSPGLRPRVLVPVLAAALLGVGFWAGLGPERGVPARSAAGPVDPTTAALPSDTDPPAAGRPAAAVAPLVELSAAGPLAQGLADELALALPPGSGPTLLARGTQGWAEDLGALRDPGRLAIARQDALQAARADASLGPLQIVLPLFTEELVFVVRADSPLRYIHQIEGRRLSVGAPESARALTVRTAYEQLFGRPLPSDSSDASDEPEALRDLLDGRVDVVALVGTVPGAWPVAPALTDAKQLRLLRLDRWNPASQRALRSLTAVQLAAGVDGLPAAQPTPTLGVRSFLVAGASPGSEPSASDLGGLARALCRQLPTLQREGHVKWREVRLGDLPEANWPYAPEAAFAVQDCVGRPARAAIRPSAASPDASGPGQP